MITLWKIVYSRKFGFVTVTRDIEAGHIQQSRYDGDLIVYHVFAITMFDAIGIAEGFLKQDL